VSLESSQDANRTHDLTPSDSGPQVFWDDATKVRGAAALPQMPAVSHARLRPGSRVQAATGMDQRNGPAKWTSEDFQQSASAQSDKNRMKIKGLACKLAGGPGFEPRL